MKISNLIQLTNESAENVFLQNLEQLENRPHEFMLGPKHHLDIPAGQVTTPIADSAAQFESHHLRLQVGDRVICLWQQASPDGNARLQFSTDGHWSPPEEGNVVPGTGHITLPDQAYRLTIGADGNLRGALASTEDDASSEPDQRPPGAAPVDPSELTMLEKLYKALNDDRPRFRGITFGYTKGNLLEGPWLLQTPNWWGKPAKDLPVDHSHALGTHIREMIARAEQVVDITTLYPEPVDGWFLECVGVALRSLVARNRPIIVRILIGNYPTKYADTAGLLRNLEKWAPGIKGSKLRIFAAGMMVTIGSWNHAKIIAVDGRHAIVGGHNLWWYDYLCSAPAHDVSMQVEGPAAHVTHGFCNRLWQHVTYWYRRGIIGIYSDEYHGPTSQIVRNSAGDVAPTPPPARGDIPILAVGRTAVMDVGAGNQSDYAFRDAFVLARKSIKFSQQDFLLLITPSLFLATALADAILRNVQVTMVLTTPGATTGSGAGYHTGATLQGAATVLVGLTLTLGRQRGMDFNRIQQLLMQNLRMTDLRFSGDQEWPAERTHPLCNQPRVAHKIANHAKVWIVDDRMFYIGSQNLYPSDNQEYGWIVESEAKTAQLLTEYWNPLWHWSSQRALDLPAVITELNLSGHVFAPMPEMNWPGA